MAPTVILIRHGEAAHNVTQNYELPDPELTEKGKQQCKDMQDHLRENLPVAHEIELIITSPMIRTLQTTTIGLDWLIKKGVPIEPDAMWQENSSKPCDTGSPAQELMQKYPSIDFSKLDPVYPSKDKGTPYHFSRTDVLSRGEACLKDLYSRKEKVIAVVSHSGFLRTGISHVKYANADYRVFDFMESNATKSDPPELLEWPLTAERGGGMGRSEKGRAEIEPRDFPQEQEEEVVGEVKEQLGEKTKGEAAKEVPDK